MIPAPDNLLEQLQNEIATKLMASAVFTGITMPDGSDFEILTEDEGDPEFLYTEMISKCGLSIVVQSPSGKLSGKRESTGVLKFTSLIIGVTVSEDVLFNRGENGTKVRLMRATREVLSLDGFASRDLGLILYASRLYKDRDTHPETGALVASRIVVFEATEVLMKTAST